VESWSAFLASLSRWSAIAEWFWSAARRVVLNLNERIFRKCRSDESFLALYRRHGIDPFDAVFLDDRLPRQFRDTRYPQMVAALREKREQSQS
jgi:hypothetical protein